jgi:hypothetical protein
MAQPNGEWLDVIAARAGWDTSRIESALASHHIVPAPVLASPRRLMLVEIAFSGVKDGVVDDGPFEFRWDALGHGLWAMLTDRNLRGKSSIMEVVRWLLRGRPSSNLQDDVRRWIHKARLRFLLDDVNHEVRLFKDPKKLEPRFLGDPDGCRVFARDPENHLVHSIDAL